MVNVETEKKYSAKELVVYQIFKENHHRDLNIKNIMELIDQKDEKISERTVYRIIKGLMDRGKIYCSDICKGMRSFELVEKNYCIMICKKCSTVNRIKTPRKDRVEQLYYKDKNFTIVGGYIELYGVCKKCIEKNEKDIDNCYQLV